MAPSSQTDRGWAWVVLAASMGSMFLNGMMVYFVGVVHSELLRKFQSSVSLTAWVGSIYVSVMSIAAIHSEDHQDLLLQYGNAPLSSLLIGRYGCRVCCVTGGILCFIGLASSAFVTSILHLLLTYGIMAGTGLCFCYSPVLVSVGFYFEKYRALASGISTAAAGVGILSGSSFMQFLMDEYTLDGAFLIISAISLHHVFFGMFLRPTEYETSNSRPDGDYDDLVVSFGSALSVQPVVVKIVSSSMSLADSNSGKDCVKKDIHLPLLNNSRDLNTSLEKDTSAQTRSYNKLSEEETQYNYEKDKDTADGKIYFMNEERESTHREHKANNKYFPINVTENVNQLTGDSVTDCSQQSKPKQITEISRTPSHKSGSCEKRADGKVTRSSRWPAAAEAYKNLYCLLGNKAFMFYSTSLMTFLFSLSGVFLHLPEYVHTLGTSPTAAASLFVPLGILSVLSRLITGVLTTDDRVHPLTINMGLAGICGLITALFPLFSGSYRGQVLYGALFGLYTGGIYTLQSVLLVKCVGVSLLNASYGLLGFMSGVGYISGPPFAALIVDMGGTYEHSFLFLGCMMEVAFLLNLATGLYLPATDLSSPDEVARVDSELTGSTLLISLSPSSCGTQREQI